jgi:flagellar hook-associated protein 2
MTTTSSTSSSATTGSSLLTALGGGSGIDTAALVSSLVSASFGVKDNALAAKEKLHTAQISAVGTLSNGITGFTTALQKLMAGGTLQMQASSSNSAIVTAKAASGADISNLSANIEVRQLAQSQSLVSVALQSTAPEVGSGSLTLTTPAGAFNIAVTASNNNLEGLAKAINDANTGTTPSGVTASVVSDSSGKRLVLKGASGASNTFSLTANNDADALLSRFVYDNANPTANPNMTRAQQAKDAIVRMDGVDSTYSTNTVTSLVNGLTLNLVSAQPGTTVQLSATHPTDALTQAVTDFVDAFNELKAQVDTVSADATADSDAGALRGTAAVREMMRQLKTVPSTKLTALDGPQTLAEIGVSTGRDGKLSLDTTKLAKAIADHPASVEAMFNPGQRSSDPNIQITNAVGAAKPGTYTVSNILFGPPASGQLGTAPSQTNFLPHVTDPNGLVAMTNSVAPGLSIHVLANVSTATISVDAGLVGILKGISDELLKNKSSTEKGALTALNETLTAQTKSLTNDRDKLQAQETAYTNQLTKQFTAMQSAVSSYKSVQSYMTQQIAMWSNKS